MEKVLLIGLGGAIGSLARWGTHTALLPLQDKHAFPWGTLAANLAGCLLIGLLAGLFAERWVVREELRLALVVGFLGGYTTFSSFALDTAIFGAQGQWGRAVANLLLNNALGIILVLAGYRLGR